MFLIYLKKAGRKLPILARLPNYMSFEKIKILLKAFVESQFGYGPLAWMFHSRRALCIVYNNNVLSFAELLELHKSFKLHYIMKIFNRLLLKFLR